MTAGCGLFLILSALLLLILPAGPGRSAVRPK